jgi:hypothetical protein
VAKLVEHSQNVDPKISLAALGKLGTVTEISAYTTRLEIDHKQVDVTPDAVVERLRSKLKAMMPAIQTAAGDVEDASITIDAPAA